MRSLSPWSLGLFALAGAAYAVASRFFLLEFLASPAGIAFVRHVDHAVQVPLARMLLGQFCYVLLLLPVTLVLAWLRIKSEAAMVILLLYAVIMMLTGFVAYQQWQRVAMGIWLFDLFGVIASVALQLALFVALRSAAGRAARRRARTS